jgi:hypothetical protein
MPTPRPIIAARSLEKLGMLTRCDARAIAPNAVPSPRSAVTTGRPIARKDPKAISSTTIAAASPSALAAPNDVV